MEPKCVSRTHTRAMSSQTGETVDKTFTTKDGASFYATHLNLWKMQVEQDTCGANGALIETAVRNLKEVCVEGMTWTDVMESFNWPRTMLGNVCSVCGRGRGWGGGELERT